MIGFDRIKIVLEGNAWLFILLALLLIGFSFFVYRYTLPRVSTLRKTILIFIRSLIFILILLLIFEPLLTLVKQRNVEKSTYVFIDNSNSIATKDSAVRINQLNSLINNLKAESGINVKLFSFGEQIDSLASNDKIISLDRKQTKFEPINNFIEKREANINNVVIVSDGIITSGIDPSYQIEKYPFKVFTVGIGDSSTQRDIQLYNVVHNQFIYVGKETKIETTILNNGFAGRIISTMLYEDDKIVGSKEIVLNSSMMNKVEYNYKPLTGGEKKLRVAVSNLNGEMNNLNNSKTIFIDVLDTKIKVVLISGSPSSDVSAISNALESDPNIQLMKFIQVAQNKFWNNNNSTNLDSAKILFLVGFPSTNISSQLFSQVLIQINKGKPFFISISNLTDRSKLKQFENFLPVSFGQQSGDPLLVQPEINSQEYSSNFSQLGNSNFIWNTLPPINQLNAELFTKPESKHIVKSKMREMILRNPLIALRSIGSQRSFLLNGWNYWRWSLLTSEKNPEFFKNFVNEIVKWLNLSADKKQFTIRTNKKIFSAGEQVEFTAELYDKSFNPIDTAQIKMVIKKGENVFNVSFSPAGNGIYLATFTPQTSGDYTYRGEVTLNNENIFTGESRFNVNDISAERLDTKMRTDFLKGLAYSTNGSYFPIADRSALTKILVNLSKKQKDVVNEKSDYELWNNREIMILIVLLFACEWFLRKRYGMI